MTTTECYINFKDINNNNIIDTIRKHGYAIITNTITDNKSDDYIDKIWKYLSNLSPTIINNTDNVDNTHKINKINKNDKSTWITYERALEENLPFHNWPKNSYGIISNSDVSHSNFVWEARCEQNIKKVFSQIWNTDKLLVSFDGICVMLPTEIGKTKEEKSWFHFDQSPIKDGFHCVQGFINLQDTSENDGCLMIYPKSNNYHKKFFEEKNLKFENDWYAFNETNKGNEWMKSHGLKPIKVTAPKGSLVLWDSRTVHCSSQPLSNNIRYAIYICMEPKYKASNDDLLLKRNIFKSRLCTTHWAIKNEIIYDESLLWDQQDKVKDQVKDQVKDKIKEEQLIINDDILSLVGYDTERINHINDELKYLMESLDRLNNKISNDNLYRQIFEDDYKNFKDFYNKTIDNPLIDIDIEFRLIKNSIFKFNNIINKFDNILV